MLERPLRYVAVLTSAIIVASFGLFAIEQTRAASAKTRGQIAAQEVNGRDPQAAAGVERLRQSRHTKGRELIDDANDVLTRPFAQFVTVDQNIWARRSLPALLALLVYGVGFSFLARYAKGSSRPRRPRSGDVPHVAGRL